jgi:hypothetical protein
MTCPGQPPARRQRQRPDEQLPGFLEPGQLVAGTRRPVPRAPLGTRVRAALWALRVAVIVVTAMIIYAFAVQLR